MASKPPAAPRRGALSRVGDRHPEITRGSSLRTSPKPRGALTRLAAEGVGGLYRLLGASEREAAQATSSFEQWNHDWNPMSAFDTVGTQLGRKAKGDRDYSSQHLKSGALNAALTIAPEAALPAAKALAKTGAGKKIVGALTASKPVSRADDGIVEGTARVTGSAPRRPAGPVRTKDGAIPQPDLSPRRGALSTPDEASIPVRHYSHTRDLKVLDPAEMGSNPRKNMSREERSQLKRVYLGENRGLPTDYDIGRDVGIGPFSYDASFPERKLVEVGSDLHQQFIRQADAIEADPALMKAWGFKPSTGRQRMVETLQQSAGFTGRSFPADKTDYGAVIHSFEPVPVTRTPEVPLRGQPLKLDAQGPHQDLRDSARQYMSDRRQVYRPADEYLEVDPQRAQAIAAAYEAMPHAPADPAVRESYGALADETIAQYRRLKDDGYDFGFYRRGEDGQLTDEYASPFDALRDLRGNKRMRVYPTDDGYGAGGITDDMVSENPMLALVPGETWDGRPVRVNDVFRAVHDAMGHGKDGFGFRAAGEENAWNSHRLMYSPVAQKAMTTETRGQNSWLNYGPHGEANRSASTADTVFAPQKIGLLPDWVLDPRGGPTIN